MKAFKSTVIAASLLMTAGCASQSGTVADGANATAANAVGCVSNCLDNLPGTSIGGGASSVPYVQSSDFTGGSTANLVVTGGTGASQTAELDIFAAGSYPVNASNVRINIDTTRASDAVIVTYTDNTGTHYFPFGTIHPYNPGVSDNSYNGWVNQNGTNVWKGFFQDAYGAIVIVLDRTSSSGLGDGNGTTLTGGSIWFANFNRLPPNDPNQGSQKMCWQISLGPYDCRTFLVGNNISMTSSLYPNNHGPQGTGYQKLGDFDYISRSSAGL